MEDGYPFSSSGTYKSITVSEETPHVSYTLYIDSLPLNADPEVFGMHPNANITCDQNETHEMFDTLLSLQVGFGPLLNSPFPFRRSVLLVSMQVSMYHNPLLRSFVLVVFLTAWFVVRCRFVRLFCVWVYQPRSASTAGLTRDDLISDSASHILDRLPEPFNIDAVSAKYPIKWVVQCTFFALSECTCLVFTAAFCFG